MKKAQLFFILFCILLSLGACRPGESQEKNPSRDSVPPISVGEEIPSEDTALIEDVAGEKIPMESGREPEDIQEEEPEASSRTEETRHGKYGPKTERFAKIMESGKYRMQFDMTFSEEDLNIKTAYDMAVNKDMFYMQVAADNPNNDPNLSATDLKTIFRDGKIYLLNDLLKTKRETSGTLREAGAIDMAGLKFVGSGKEGSLEYEEYSTSGGGTLRYYTRGGSLVRFSSASEDVTLEGENVRLSQDVPDSLFSIPGNYQKVVD